MIGIQTLAKLSGLVHTQQ